MNTNSKLFKGFAAKYNLIKPVYFESTNNVTDAINREKQLKGWTREKKISLISGVNPLWEDLSL